MTNFFPYKKGFTLAEVLITLVIIGIVSALTLPSLIAKYHEQQIVTSVNEIYSLLQQAFKSAVFENGHVDSWDMSSCPSQVCGGIKITDILTKYLNVQKYCKNNIGCWTQGNTLYLNGTFWTDSDIYNSPNVSKFVLTNGWFVLVNLQSKLCDVSYSTGNNISLINNVCGMIYVDINGAKGQNQVGKDLFAFYFNKNGEIAPVGIFNSASHSSHQCNKSSRGETCSYWVISKKNMNYLHN